MNDAHEEGMLEYLRRHQDGLSVSAFARGPEGYDVIIRLEGPYASEREARKRADAIRRKLEEILWLDKG